MLSKISLLSFFLFSVIYPLCFWVSLKDPLKEGFHKFHIGLPCVTAGVLLFFIYTGEFSSLTKQWTLIWVVSLLLMSFINWTRESANAALMTLPFFPGIKAYSMLHMELLRMGGMPLSILGGFILASVLFAMNLGHWYLNVHGLPIAHLKRAMYVFWAFVALRFVADICLLFTQTVFYRGEYIPLLSFMQNTDGFFVWIAIFFGTLFPLGATYFVKGVLDLKNTQSATGILYVILAGVLIGELTYKYYLVKYGVIL